MFVLPIGIAIFFVLPIYTVVGHKLLTSELLAIVAIFNTLNIATFKTTVAWTLSTVYVWLWVLSGKFLPVLKSWLFMRLRYVFSKQTIANLNYNTQNYMFYSAEAQCPNKKLLELYRLHCSMAKEVFQTLMSLDAACEKSLFSEKMSLCFNFQSAVSQVQVCLWCVSLWFTVW